MLQMTAEQFNLINRDNIGQLLQKIRPILDHRRRMYERYSRKISQIDTMGGGYDENGKRHAIVAFEFYVVNMVQGYLGGKAPAYSVQKGDKEESYVKDYTDAIEKIRRYNDDAATYIELIHDYLITSAAHLYIYENEDNEIVYTRFDSRQTVGIFDYATPPNQIGCVRTWEQADVKGQQETVVEVISDGYRRKFIGKDFVFSIVEEPEMLSWGDVPCVTFEHPDGITVFEPAISPIDTYEQLINNVRNMTQYNDDAKLLVYGYNPANQIGTPERDKEDAEWLRANVLFIGEGGKIEWLLKSIDYSGTLSLQKSLHDLITMLTGVPNMTDEAFSSADNASALGYKLYALDQYCATSDRVFRKGYLRLWEIITNRLNLKGADFDFRDINIVMQRNIPTDKDKSISRAATMKSSGLFSDLTCINESQVEVDAQEELERRDQETEKDYETMMKRNQQNPQEEPDDDGQEANP
ncbi:phage portal protein [Fumia xinanensis]|uniref:Phage portal protein n=1 Tax=Fumia xinanensis TaxID=2763659 RepID=A0A926E3L0_9FIRM|nr:phage portal protein [Fumia xinanensis]MBC8558890.1 phage portal protein [Fumia xinanensis]